MTSFNKYFVWIFVAVALYVIVILFKSFHTIIIDGDHYRSRVTSLKIDSVSIQQLRGFIFSDNNEMLAGSLPEYDVFLDFYSTTKEDGPKGQRNIPIDTISKYFGPNGAGSKALAHADGSLSAAEYGKRVRKAYSERNPSYFVLKALPYMKYKELRQQPFFNKSVYLCGVIPRERSHRYRPYGERRMAATTIGNIYALKDSASSGIEKAFDEMLRGKPGFGYTQRIRRRKMEVTREQPINGADVHTTINVEIQDILDRALCQRILELHAAGGWAAVMEVETGKIKAISNLKRISDSDCIEDHNHLMEDLYDPGSTFKTVSMMVMLDDGKVTPETIIDTRNTKEHPGDFNCHGKHIKDDHPVGVVTADEAICQSSNIAVAMLTTQAYESNPEAYFKGIEKIGMLDDLELRNEFPKAEPARKRRVGDDTWSKVSLGQISYGYENRIPGIYMLNFYNAIANDGRLMRPYIVESVTKHGETLYEREPEVLNRHICSSSTLKAIHHMLRGVVDHGTAKAIKSDKVTIAGKTGTAQRYDNGSYSLSNGHYVSFVGYFPADEPQYSCIVVLSIRPPYPGRPGGGYMAGPVFKTLAEEVSALHCRRKIKAIEQDTLHPFFPAIKGGVAGDISYVLDKLDFKTDNITASQKDFAMAAPTDIDESRRKATYEISSRKVTQGCVPNVKGMGAADALFLLESCGLRVGMTGKGQVVSQSLDVGGPCRKGDYISITLK